MSRKKSYVAVLENKIIKIVTGEDSKEYISRLSFDNNDHTEIKGMCACKGKVVGRVKILAHDAKNIAEEMKSMKKGDILVATQTKPQFMLAIGKAAAIITDEGGICSHVAIVSRELNIPAVIGTQNATKYLKDGDLVEVDAVKCVVKKIRL